MGARATTPPLLPGGGRGRSVRGVMEDYRDRRASGALLADVRLLGTFHTAPYAMEPNAFGFSSDDGVEAALDDALGLDAEERN